MNRQELVIQEARFLHNSNGYATAHGTSSIGLCHSEMAMHAAKKMRRSRQKLKTGSVVCHHLRMMLAANEPVAPVSRIASSSTSSSTFSLTPTLSFSLTSKPMIESTRFLSSVSRQQEETQFSLGI